MPFKFTIKNRDGNARTGALETAHGIISTPAFVPVATKATIKTLTKDDLEELGIEILMCNTYHLMLKPGTKTINELGKLHNFMNWKKPLMTDSAGFQAFSLGLGMEYETGKMFPEGHEIKKRENAKQLAKITEEGIHFKSVYDGARHFLSPEESMQKQHELGADIMFAFDECTSPLSDYEYTKKSLGRTHRWAERCVKFHEEAKKAGKSIGQALFGIIQGGHFKDLREESTEFISSLPFDGIAVGGSLGRSKKDMHEILGWVIPKIPEDKPIHLLGIGTVEDFFECVKRGVDLFDCVAPPRLARSGYAYILPQSGGNKKNKFRYRVKNVEYVKDTAPLDPNCKCKMCRTYTRAYVNHLFKAEEYLAYTIVTYHNLYFMLELMKNIRKGIDDGGFDGLMGKWIR